jgi:LPXTG-site transpeptidase (sortase) family protein
MTAGDLLRWLERGLLATGIALAVWCAVVLVEARYHKALPVPPPPAVATPLPGETPGPNAHPHATIEAGSWVARIDAPSVNLSATVLEGSDDGTLARGAGHIEDTPFPGEAGNVGIAGHRDTTFRPVRNLHVGDPLVVTTSTRVYRYRISKTAIVEPEDVYVLDPADHPTLTLVTCYPFEYVGHAPHRFIVSADLTGQEERIDRPGARGSAGGSATPRGPGR